MRLGNKVWLNVFGNYVPAEEVDWDKQESGAYKFGDLIIDDENQIRALDEWYAMPLPNPKYERDTGIIDA